mmetsp:Transcript_14470/g.21759  ORF Transcript_14470/g.21759 Transcript_14470/m.21759 type:complete len:593 (-) Transcript_14470:45-1823(-)
MSERWSILTSCLFVAGVTGLATSFGLFSKVLQDKLNYSASEIALIGSFGNLGSYSGIFTGYIVNTYGPRIAIQSAAILIFIGLFCMWLSVDDAMPTSVGVLCLFIFIALVGGSLISQGTLSCSLNSFPSESRGRIASLAKAYYGIAGALLSAVAATIYDDRDTGFVLFASIFISMCALCASVFINQLPTDMKSFAYEQRNGILTSLSPYFSHFYFLISVITVAVMLSLTVKNRSAMITVGVAVIAAMFTITLLPYSFYFSAYTRSFRQSIVGEDDQRNSIRMEGICSQGQSNIHKESSSIGYNDENSNYKSGTTCGQKGIKKAQQGFSQPLLPQIETGNDSQHCATTTKPFDDVSNEPQNKSANSETCNVPSGQNPCLAGERDLTLVEMLQTYQCWVVFLILSSIYGSTLLVINLIEPISVSQRVSASAPVLVFILNISSSLGRISIGHVSEYFKGTLSLVQMLGCGNLFVAVVNFCFALYIPVEAVFYILVFCIGALYGAIKVLAAAYAVDMYGVTHVATNNGFFGLSGAVGSYVIAYGLVEIFHPSNVNSGNQCIGSKCFQSIFFVSSFICVVGFVVAMFLDYRLKKVAL